MPGLAHMDSPILIGVAKDVYPSLMGNLRYAAVCTRPCVSTVVSILGSPQANPTKTHLQTLKKVVRYLKETIDRSHTLGVRTTTSNLHASWMQIGLMIAVRASHDLGTCLHSVEATSTTSLNIRHASPCEAKYYFGPYATKKGIHLRQVMGEIFNETDKRTTTV
jgi:hypothetical protein